MGALTTLISQGELPDAAKAPGTAMVSKMSGLRKAAILVMTLGEECSRALLRGLGEADLQRLTEEISRVARVSPEEQTEVLYAFYGLQTTQQYVLHGGPEMFFMGGPSTPSSC